jgi:hypothetical protein
LYKIIGGDGKEYHSAGTAVLLRMRPHASPETRTRQRVFAMGALVPGLLYVLFVWAMTLVGGRG